MGLLDHFEKLINEHGSAAILREHLALVRAEQSALEKAHAATARELDQLRHENAKLRDELSAVKQQLSSVSAKYVCDHCGSTSLVRTGSRADPTFGDLGIKQSLFSCGACGKQSAFTEQP